MRTPQQLLNAMKSGSDRAYWRMKWQDALASMPYRISQGIMIEFVPAHFKVSVPEYIKGSLKDKYRMIDGKVHVAVKRITKNKYGQTALLAKLLGYKGTTGVNGKVRPHTNRIYTATSTGETPRDPETRKLLLAYASKGGRSLAIQHMQEMGISVHNYHFEWDD